MTKPTVLPVLSDNIPAELKAIPRWVCWSLDWVEGKWAKVPKQPDGRNASSTNPRTWSTFEQALAGYTLDSFDGIGLVIDGSDQLVGVDLDDCVSEAGALNALAVDTLSRVQGYAEVSPSGTGIKIFARGVVARAHKKAEMEVYPNGRYFTVTGHLGPDHHQMGPDQTEQLTALIADQFGQRNVRSLVPVDGLEDDAAAFVQFDATKQPASGWDLERVTAELLQPEVLDPDCGYDEWVGIGMALHHQGDGGVEWLEAWDDWSRGSPKHVEGYCEEKWASFGGRAGGITLASLLAKTREVRAARAALFDPPAPPPVAATPELTDQQKHDAVLQRYLDQIVAIDTPSYLEGEFAKKMQDMDWTRAERLRVAKGMRDQYKALTGVLVSMDIAKAWVEPVAGPASFPDVTSDGRILGTHRNVESLLTQLGATIRYNVIAKEDEVTVPGRSFTHDNSANASVAMLLSECNAVDMKINASTLKAFITLIADSNQYNPALDWITSKPWDGVDRFPDWCATVVSPNPYVKEIIMRRWALQAIAVLFNTGKFQARGVLTFSGVQYAGKSRWLRSLAPEGMVHTGHLLDVHNKDSIKIAIACWICELGEIDGTLRKSDLAALKAFISQELDTFRRPYAMGESTYPRRTVFGATVNEQRYLRDTTGNTRFWSIAVDSINPDHDVDMQQFWAQMLVLWQGGEQHWMTEEEMKLLNTSNEEFTVADPVEEVLRTKLDWEADRSTWVWMTVSELAESLGMQRQSISGLHSLIGKALKRITGQESKSNGTVRRSFVPRLRSLTQDFPDS